MGGGHAHVHVLRMLARGAAPAARVTLVSPEPYAVYSGMIPGVLVGLHAPEASRIDVAALAARAGAALLADRVVGIDPRARRIELAERGAIAYDVLSLDIGSRPRGVDGVGSLPIVVPVKPVEAAAARVGAFLAAAARGEAQPRAVVVGAGAAGVEVGFALDARLRAIAGAGGGGARVVLVERAEDVLPGMAPPVRRLVRRLLEERGIAVQTRVAGVLPDARGVALGDGERIDAGLVLWATGAEGWPVLATAGLPLDARGFVRVDATLRSAGSPEVFAAGDCAALVEHPDLPRAGVFAVREGPILAHNLGVALAGRGRLRRYRPQRDFLALLATGDGRAVLSYRGRAGHGRFWWRLKSWIDTRFIARHEPPDPARLRAPMRARGAEMRPCGGCAAKVDAETLARALRALGADHGPGVAVGLDAPDDAAVLRVADGAPDVVATVDAFPPFHADLFAVGEIAAVNAASDVFAMGGTPTAALAIVSPPDGSDAARESDLGLLLRGARRGLRAMDIDLVGGHTVAAGEALIGFTVLGRVDRGALLTKGGARPGDRLFLTKPLGTGVVLAAARAGECPAAWVERALASMRRSNAEAARTLVAAGVRCCTDVSGFGLLGHLLEMLRASGVEARLALSAVPALPGARELLRAGWRSSADRANRAALASATLAPGLGEGDPHLALLCDPQTSGGLLAAIAPERVCRVVDALSAAGVEARAIGDLSDGAAGRLVIEP